MLLGVFLQSAFYNNKTGPDAYWCCTACPNEGGLLGFGQLFINKDALLQVQQQGDAGHEGEHGVEAKIKHIHLWNSKRGRERGVQIIT